MRRRARSASVPGGLRQKKASKRSAVPFGRGGPLGVMEAILRHAPRPCKGPGCPRLAFCYSSYQPGAPAPGVPGAGAPGWKRERRLGDPPTPSLDRHFGLLHATGLNVTILLRAGVLLTILPLPGPLPAPSALPARVAT